MFMDGLDLIETTGRMSVLGWLPDPLPKVKFLTIFEICVYVYVNICMLHCEL